MTPEGAAGTQAVMGPGSRTPSGFPSAMVCTGIQWWCRVTDTPQSGYSPVAEGCRRPDTAGLAEETFMAGRNHSRLGTGDQWLDRTIARTLERNVKTDVYSLTYSGRFRVIIQFIFIQPFPLETRLFCLWWVLLKLSEHQAWWCTERASSEMEIWILNWRLYDVTKLFFFGEQKRLHGLLKRVYTDEWTDTGFERHGSVVKTLENGASW